jgi:hypothetical protein
MHWLVVVLLLASLAGAWNWWSSERHERVPPGILVPDAPVQQMLDPPSTFAAKEHEFEARARYDITARVLRKEIYRIDGGANLAPVDLGLGWGAMSDTTVVDALGSRRWAVSVLEAEGLASFPLTAAQTVAQAAQVHAIPADAAIERRLRSLRPGRSCGFRAISSTSAGRTASAGGRLSRNDTGDGACEIMWIESLAIE